MQLLEAINNLEGNNIRIIKWMEIYNNVRELQTDPF